MDLAVVLASGQQRSEAIERLVGIGYAYVGDLGVVGRDQLHGPPDEPSHHLHVLTEGSALLAKLVAFRDALRADRSLCSRYGDARLAAAGLGRPAYEAVKTAFFAT